MLRKTGTITLGNKIAISDPCYELGTWCQGTLENILPGEYNCSYNYDENESRISFIHIAHSSLSNDMLNEAIANSEAADFEVGVDSGMAGIYDYDYYASNHEPELNKTWYNAVFQATKNIQPNKNYRKFMSQNWFLAIIDEYIEFIRTIIKPEDNINLYFPMLSDIDAIMGCSHTLEFADILEEKLKAVNLYDGKIMSVSDDITDNQKALIAMADVKFQTMMERTRNKIPNSQFHHDTIEYLPATVDNKAFVSLSGFGDGSYTCYFHKNENNMIDFIEIYYYDAENDE